MQRTFLAVAVAMLAAACTPGTTPSTTPDAHEVSHAAPARPKGEKSVAGSTQAFQHANHAMHQGMGIDYTGNPDVDFLRGMIPHHQGAIDMAKIELQYGADPEVRALAQQIIAAQEQEIAMMRDWLAKRASPSPKH